MTDAPAVDAAGLRWTYRGRTRPAIDGLTFRLEAGRVLLVLGPSGCGKSTLARALIGLVPHVLPGTWEGSLQIGDLDVATTPARLLGERVGLVFQDPDSQLVMARAEDEVAFGLENRGWPRDTMVSRVPEALGEVGLAGFDRRATATLSGGEKQRLAIADVLAPLPGLLVFDEPTANLDPPGMHETFERLARLARRRERTIVLIEHRLEAALPLADDVLLLDGEGRQIAFTPAADVRGESVELLRETGAWVPRAWVPRAWAAGAGPAGRDAQRESGTAEPQGDAGVDAAAIDVPEIDRDRRARGGGATVGSDHAVEATGVGVAYPAEASDRRSAGTRLALDSIDFTIAPGQRVAVVGPNGSGKSTLLLVLAGLLRPTAGRVAVRSRGEPRDPARLRPDRVPETVGLVFQDPELGFVARTVRDEVCATARATGNQPSEADGAAVLEAFGLGRLADVEPFRLSQGEQRRLSLAAYALRPPGLLLLDEPTFGLDRRGTDAVFGLLDRLRDGGQTQVLATHDPRLLPRCDRVVALDRGRVAFDGPPSAFLEAPPFRPTGPWREGASAVPEQDRPATEPAEATA